jgi:dTDP-4-dehydrorhamnose reductase
MKILIIGSKGTLGQALADAFSDMEPILWDKNELDITDEKEAIKKISWLKPEVILNAAAYTDVDGAEKNEELANKINGYAAGNLARAAKLVGAVLVQYSTDYVFDGTKKEGYSEKDETKPVSVYGSSKLLGETEAQRGYDKVYVIRLSRLFGKAGSGAGSKKSFIDLMLDLASRNKELNVVDEELSSPTYAPDITKRTREIIEKKEPFGIYHLANSGSCTWYDFAKEIFKIKGVDIVLNRVDGNYFKRDAKRPAYSVLLNTKLPATRPWQEALREYLSNFQ